MVFIGCPMVAFSLEPILIDGQSPSYILAVGPMLVGTGCAMLAYHIRKGGEEDTAAKKIVLAGTAVSIPMATLEILNPLNIL